MGRINRCLSGTEEQRRALALWVHSESYAAIAVAVACGSTEAAEKLVRAAIERLRRKFRAGGAADE